MHPTPPSDAAPPQSHAHQRQTRQHHHSSCINPFKQKTDTQTIEHAREEGAGFSQKLILLLQLAHPPTQSSDLSFHLAWIRTTRSDRLASLALEFDPPAQHRFAQAYIPSHRRDRRPRIQHQSHNIKTILRRKTTTSSHNRHLTGRRHTHPLHEVSTTPA